MEHEDCSRGFQLNCKNGTPNGVESLAEINGTSIDFLSMVVDIYLSIRVLRVKTWSAVQFSGRKPICELRKILFSSKYKYNL